VGLVLAGLATDVGVARQISELAVQNMVCKVGENQRELVLRKSSKCRMEIGSTYPCFILVWCHQRLEAWECHTRSSMKWRNAC
jgi:hypothetical protein